MNKQYQQSTSQNNQQINPKTYTPTIGMINNIKTIDCHISLSPQNQSHKFTVNYKPLNIFPLLVKRRLVLAFENIASMTYQLKVKQSNVFIPQALLNGDTNIIHQYKKLLEKGKIQSYIKLNIRKQEVSRQKRPRPVSLKEKDSKSNLQQLYNKKMTIANNNYMINLMQKNSLLIDNLDSNQTTVKKLSNSRNQKLWQQKQIQTPLFKSTVFKPFIQQNTNQKYLSVPGEFRQQIHHHHSFYHHKKTKKSSQSLTNKSQKKNPFQGIKINYFQVKSSTKENPQMATFIYPNMGLNNKSGPKSVRENNSNNSKSIIKNSKLRTQFIDIQNLQKKSSQINYLSPSKNDLFTDSNIKNYEQQNKHSPIHNYMQTDKYSIHSSHMMMSKHQLNDKKIKTNNSLFIDDGFKNDEKKLNSYLLGEQFNTGNPLTIGHHRNIVKRKVKIYTNDNNDFTNTGLQMNMV